MGSAGIGTGSHIAGEYFFKMLAKAPVKHIPFPGGNPAMMGLLAGDVNVLAATATGNIARAVNNGDTIGLGDRGGRKVAGPADGSDLRRERLSRDVRSVVGRVLCARRHARSRVGKAQSARSMRSCRSRRSPSASRPPACKRQSAAKRKSAKLFSAEIKNWSTMVQAVGIPKH